MNVYIKNPAPELNGPMRWGDDYFGHSLAAAFARRGAEVVQEFWPNWVDQPQNGIVLVLRGLRPWSPPNGGFRILWILSHPLDVTQQEMDAYDLVLVASRLHARLLRQLSSTPVEVAMQCTDPELFHGSQQLLRKQVLTRRGTIYVANSRGIRRDMAQWIHESKSSVEIVGRAWSHFGLADLVQAEHIANDELGTKYRNARLALNDHWLDMRSTGYVNNRIFDCLSCGVPVLSDDFPELRSLFGDALLYAGCGAEFRAALDYCEAEYGSVLERVHDKWQSIQESFTFDARAEEILHWVSHPPESARGITYSDGTVLERIVDASLRSNVRHEEQRAGYYETELKRQIRTVNEAADRLAALERRAVESEQRVSEAQKQWALAAHHWESTAAKLEAAQQQATQLKIECNELESKLSRVEHESKQTKIELHAAIEANEAARRQAADFEQLLHDSEKRARMLDVKSHSLEEENSLLKVRIDAMMKQLPQYLRQLELELESVLSSTSWRLTGPLRTTKLLLSRSRAKGYRSIDKRLVRPLAVEALLTAGQTSAIPIVRDGIAPAGIGGTPSGATRGTVRNEARKDISGLGRSLPYAEPRTIGAPTVAQKYSPNDAHYWQTQARFLLEELEALREQRDAPGAGDT